MKFFNEFGVGLGHYSIAYSFVKKHRLWYWLIIPCLLNLLAFFIVGYFSWVYTGDLLEYLLMQIGVTGDSWWKVSLQVVISVFVRLIIIMLYLKLFRYIVLIFFAPMLAFISDKIQEISTGKLKPFTTSQFVKDVVRGVTIALRNLGMELLLTTCILLLAFAIPVLAVLAPFVIFAVESYYFGFAMLDYRNEFMMISAKASREMINQHKGLILGIGSMFNIMLFVPFLGVLVAPVLAVVAAGLAFNKVVSLDDLNVS
jgi:CysZ protein